MQVKNIMSHDVESIGPDSTIPEIATMMRDRDIGAVPVIEDGKCLGIVTDRDVVVRGIAGDEGAVCARTAREIMSRNVLSCTEDQTLGEVGAHMQAGTVRRLAVIDDAGRLKGMVSIGDLAVAEECNAGSALGLIAQS